MASVSQKIVAATYQVLCPVLEIFDPTKSPNSKSTPGILQESTTHMDRNIMLQDLEKEMVKF
jgi:hypothetical protein